VLNTLVSAKEHTQLADDKTLVLVVRGSGSSEGMLQSFQPRYPAPAAHDEHQKIEAASAAKKAVTILPSASHTSATDRLEAFSNEWLKWGHTGLLVVIAALQISAIVLLMRYFEPQTAPPKPAEASARKLEAPLSGASIADNLTLDTQYILQTLGYFKGQVDGRLGPDTEAAIKQFEMDIKIEPTGRPTEILLKQLRDRLAEISEP
jgi:hypothetical protein